MKKNKRQMIPEQQQILVNNGWSRYHLEYKKGEKIKVPNTDKFFLSTYGPLEYFFEKNGVVIWWGLDEAGLPPRWSFDQQRMAHELTPDQFLEVVNNYAKQKAIPAEQNNSQQAV